MRSKGPEGTLRNVFSTTAVPTPTGILDAFAERDLLTPRKDEGFQVCHFPLGGQRRSGIGRVALVADLKADSSIQRGTRGRRRTVLAFNLFRGKLPEFSAKYRRSG